MFVLPLLQVVADAIGIMGVPAERIVFFLFRASE